MRHVNLYGLTNYNLNISDFREEYAPVCRGLKIALRILLLIKFHIMSVRYFTAQWLLYVPPTVTSRNSTVHHTVFHLILQKEWFFLKQFPHFQQTDAHTGHLIHNNIFKNIRLLNV